VRVPAGERVGVGFVPGDTVSLGVETRNANVGSDERDKVPEAVGEGEGEGLEVGLGVGEGIIFSQRCNGMLAPRNEQRRSATLGNWARRAHPSSACSE
jgi:hypothetical protein